MYSVGIYSRVGRACLKDGIAARYFNKDRKTIAKFLRHELPPGYRRSEAPRRPALDGYVGPIDEILRTDNALIKKQRHTVKRIFERLRDQHNYTGSLSPSRTDLFILRGVPSYIRSDNGLEFIAEAVRDWVKSVGAKTAYIEPGSPSENGYCESFNGRMRPSHACKHALPGGGRAAERRDLLLAA